MIKGTRMLKKNINVILELTKKKFGKYNLGRREYVWISC